MAPSPASRPELLALLGDVKDNPHEDGLRLVLADWLEEYGSPLELARAELIRSQIEFSRLGPEVPRRAELGRRARALQQKHGHAWLDALARWTRTWVHQRGLLSVNLPAASLRSQALLALAGTEAWAWVEEVYLAGAHETEVVRLRDCALLETICALGFHQGDIGPAGAEALAEMPWLGRLDRLDLGNQAITDSGVSALLGSPRLGRLRTLELPQTQLTPSGARALASATGLARLQRLVLWGNELGDLGVSHLAATACLASLTSLDLRGNGVGDGGARALAGSATLAGLRELNLANNQVGPAGAAALACSPSLDNLTSLVLWGNPVGAEGVRLLRQRFGLRVHVSSQPA